MQMQAKSRVFSLTSICQYGVRWASVIMDDTLDTGGALFHGIGGTNWWETSITGRLGLVLRLEAVAFSGSR
jgi:hypothetical protein